MSASLVGSEMCIRDSSSTLARPRRASSEGKRAAYPELRAVAAERGARPVSYTHLTLPTICSV
eukprot:9277945-Alexandrium_andersonii.AAC.1